MTKTLLKKVAGLRLFSCASAQRSKTSDKTSPAAASARRHFGRKFSRTYTVLRVLGSGGFGTVYAGYRNSDRKPVAIKVARKDRTQGWVEVDGVTLPREVSYLQRLQHVDGVVKLLGYYDNRNSSSYVVVMERFERSQDLFDYITTRGRLDETEARGFLSGVVRTLVEVHAAGVFHRDVKDENVIVDLDTNNIRLVDFGSATDLDETTAYRDFDGTLLYSSPEWLLTRQYSAESYTVWTLGIFIYSMITGKLPFSGVKEIIAADPVIPDHLSADLTSLMKSCLSADPEHRPTLRQILDHPWMTSSSASCDVIVESCAPTDDVTVISDDVSDLSVTSSSRSATSSTSSIGSPISFSARSLDDALVVGS